MWSSSGISLLLLPCVALGAVVLDNRNFIQAPALCEPPYAVINDRCVFVVERDSGEMGCSEASDSPCRKGLVIAREAVSSEDVIIDGNNNNQLDERTLTGTRDCKQGYRFVWGRCREVFKGVQNQMDDRFTKELDGDFNSLDRQIEDIYNTQLETQAKTEIAQKDILETPRKCKPGYRPDKQGRCRDVFNSASSNFQKERNDYSLSAKGFIQAGLSACKPGYRHDRKGTCRKIFNPASSNNQLEGSDYSVYSKGLLQVALSACKPGFIQDKKGNCREIFNAPSSNTKKEQSGKSHSGKALIATATAACKAGYRRDSEGRCRKVYTPATGYSLKEDSGEDESTKGFIQVPGCSAGAVLINGDCRPIYSGKRELNGEDYVDTNENPLMQPDLWRRRRSLGSQKH